MIQRISIHALLAESDQTVTKWASSAKISIHALLAESDKSSWSLTRLNRNISIHALLAESDLFFIVFDLFRNISIHALLAESDSPLSINCMIHMQFLSTLSLRRATMQIVIIVVDTVISIHALLAESDVVHIAEHASPGGISIHALLAESDKTHHQFSSQSPVFLSTLSLRRATADCPSMTVLHCNFYPRSPCGERQSTASQRKQPKHISIHALLAESDRLDSEY